MLTGEAAFVGARGLAHARCKGLILRSLCAPVDLTFPHVYLDSHPSAL